jgi:hypothetical protein
VSSFSKDFKFHALKRQPLQELFPVFPLLFLQCPQSRPVKYLTASTTAIIKTAITATFCNIFPLIQISEYEKLRKQSFLYLHELLSFFSLAVSINTDRNSKQTLCLCLFFMLPL